MKKHFFLLLLGLGMIACETDGDCTPDAFLTIGEPNQSIEVTIPNNSTEPVYTVINGDKIVFTYTREGAQCDNVLDDEVREEIIFEIDPTLTQFAHTDDEILLITAYYHRSGAWFNFQGEINVGSIEGVKLSDNQWEIKASVEVPTMNPNSPIKVIAFTRIYTVL